MKSFQVCKIWWCMMISLHQCFWNIDTYLWLSLQVQVKCCGQPGFESSRLKLCAATCPFCNDKICMTLSLSLSLHMILYCCALFSFFLSWNLPWAISGPRLRLVLTQFEIFTRTYNIPCFGAIESSPGPGIAHMRWPGTWAVIMGHFFCVAIVQRRSFSTRHIISWNCLSVLVQWQFPLICSQPLIA